jgi:hypothetical protein
MSIRKSLAYRPRLESLELKAVMSVATPAGIAAAAVAPMEVSAPIAGALGPSLHAQPDPAQTSASATGSAALTSLYNFMGSASGDYIALKGAHGVTNVTVFASDANTPVGPVLVTGTLHIPSRPGQEATGHLTIHTSVGSVTLSLVQANPGGTSQQTGTISGSYDFTITDSTGQLAGAQASGTVNITATPDLGGGLVSVGHLTLTGTATGPGSPGSGA